MQRAVGRRLLGKNLVLAKQSAVLSEEAARLIGHEDRASLASGLDAKECIKQPSTIDHMDFGLLALRADQRRQEAKASPARRLRDLMASQEEIPHTEATFAFGDLFSAPLTRGGPRTRTLATSPSSRTLPSPLEQHQSRVATGDSLLAIDLYLERWEILTRRPGESGARGSGRGPTSAPVPRPSPAKNGGASSGYGKTVTLRLRTLDVMA